jgi:hypothetical protein
MRARAPSGQSMAGSRRTQNRCWWLVATTPGATSMPCGTWPGGGRGGRGGVRGEWVGGWVGAILRRETREPRRPAPCRRDLRRALAGPTPGVQPLPPAPALLPPLRTGRLVQGAVRGGQDAGELHLEADGAVLGGRRAGWGRLGGGWGRLGARFDSGSGGRWFGVQNNHYKGPLRPPKPPSKLLRKAPLTAPKTAPAESNRSRGTGSSTWRTRSLQTSTPG